MPPRESGAFARNWDADATAVEIWELQALAEGQVEDQDTWAQRLEGILEEFPMMDQPEGKNFFLNILNRFIGEDVCAQRDKLQAQVADLQRAL